MKKKLNVILSASGHLPGGTGEAEFEALYNTEIKPLVQALDKFPRINVVFHYSGVLFYWIERRHPELFMLLEDLLSRKQAEFLGGGFYDPMLPLLPLADKIGQIEMLTTYLRKHFGKRPQGCRVPPSAWEQNLAGLLSSCGMNYTFLEDCQFSGAGIKPDRNGFFSPCITEDQGKLIIVFPLARAMGRALRDGTKKADELFSELSEEPAPGGVAEARAFSRTENKVLVLPVEGEGRGPGPDYEKLFEKLSAEDPETEFTLPSRIYKNLKRLGKIYFPSMDTRESCAGNSIHPRQFLAERPEAGGIYAKMIHVHTLINNKLRGDKTRKRTAQEELWKAQDSGIYRPGTAALPGLLHAPVRNAAYRSLLEAEKITREKGKFIPSLSLFDFDLDGEDEYIFQDDKLNCCIKSRGGGIFELDYLSGTWNYLDTLSSGEGARRVSAVPPDAAVSALPGESGGGRERRCAFVDWLAPAGTLPETAGPAGIPSGYFCGFDEYEAFEINRERRRLGLRLPARPGFPFGEIEIEKTWQLKKNSFALEYALKNTGAEHRNFIFSPSIDLSFPGEGESFLRIFVQREAGKESVPPGGACTVENSKILEFQDIQNETLVTLESSRGSDSRIFHVRAGGEDGIAGYQSSCVMPFFSVSLEAGKIWKLAFLLRISS